ncbi:hypothetical protein RYZ20_06365 [Thioclava sp. A2]|uniref:hypothetical protein n=1 Tax=Thioclava sp. FCG-A2 TaxID=3080562 RepID=UPI002955C272|nr:hypothetical protein [Thioclava sp. A2]MDV7270520.1 hypothetical protein [Thioclava sp. A2]
MSEIGRDTVLDYRPGPDSELPLEEGETVLATFLPDAGRYWKDHALLGLLGVALVALGLWYLGNLNQLAVAAIAIVVGMTLRGWYFRSEVFARRWQLTERRLIGPQGRQVMLLEITAVRRLMGDVQIVTKSGGKHLIRHQADAEAVANRIEAAQAARKGANT